MLLGVLVGYLFPASGPVRLRLFWDFAFDATQLKPLSDAFIRLIRMMIAPIIFTTVVKMIGAIIIRISRMNASLSGFSCVASKAKSQKRRSRTGPEAGKR